MGGGRGGRGRRGVRRTMRHWLSSRAGFLAFHLSILAFSFTHGTSTHLHRALQCSTAPGFSFGVQSTCDCGLCLVRLSARKPWSRGARAVTRCTRRRAAAAATTTRAPTAAMATMAAPVSCAAGPAARSASASTHPPRPPSRSYRPQLPSSATVLSYRPQLPPSATALSYRPQLPPSATALSYRPQLPPLRLSCKPMHAPPAGARGGRPGLPARSAAHPVLGDCRGDEPLPKGSPRRGWGVRRDAPAIR